jgi:hypothetical protein
MKNKQMKIEPEMETEKKKNVKIQRIKNKERK